jgi:hypothetical protein
MDSKKKQAAFLTVVLATMLAFPVTGFAAETKSLEALAAESANTPEQHQALAAYYKGRAEDAKAEAKLHQGMALSYSAKGAGAGSGMQTHCANLTKAATQAATEYEALAAFHEAEARKAN